MAKWRCVLCAGDYLSGVQRLEVERDDSGWSLVCLTCALYIVTVYQEMFNNDQQVARVTPPVSTGR